MQYRTSTAVTGLQLDPSFATAEAPHRLHMAQSIAAETESKRAELRSHSTWGLAMPQSPSPIRGFAPAAERLHQPNTLLADMLPWPALLTFGECANNAARRAGCTHKEILDFALSICPFEHIVLLVNYIAQVGGVASAAKVLSPLIRGLKAKEERIKQGARVGGKKSAKRRLKQSNVPEPTRLLQERQRLLDAGREARDVASILAQRFGVHPSTIRSRLRDATKSQAE